MDAQSPTFQTRPFLKIRRAYGDVLAAARAKDIIHGLIEVDVTDVRREIARRRALGEDVSFNAYLLYAIGRAVDEDRALHAYRCRSRLVIFDDVDANTQIEAAVGSPSRRPRSPSLWVGSPPSRAMWTTASNLASCSPSPSQSITPSSTGHPRPGSRVGCPS